MKTYYVLDSSNYYITKLVKKALLNKEVEFIHLKENVELSKDKNLIVIANDTDDLIDFFLLHENNKRIILIISSHVLFWKLRKSKKIQYFHFYDFLENFNIINK